MPAVINRKFFKKIKKKFFRKFLINRRNRFSIQESLMNTQLVEPNNHSFEASAYQMDDLLKINYIHFNWCYSKVF